MQRGRGAAGTGRRRRQAPRPARSAPSHRGGRTAGAGDEEGAAVPASPSPPSPLRPAEPARPLAAPVPSLGVASVPGGATAVAGDRGAGERAGEEPGPTVYRAQRRAASRARRLRPTASISLHGAVGRGRSRPPRVCEVLRLCACLVRRPPRRGSGRRGPPGGGGRPRSLGNGGGRPRGPGGRGGLRTGAGAGGAGEVETVRTAHTHVKNRATGSLELPKPPG